MAVLLPSYTRPMFICYTGAAAYMATADKITIRADDDFTERVEHYRERAGKESRTEAIKDLVEVGLREQSNPLLYRLKDRVLEWVNLLAMTAIVMFVVGVTTDIITATNGVIGAFFALFLASGLLAAYELVRAVGGMNEMGVRARQAADMVVGRHE